MVAWFDGQSGRRLERTPGGTDAVEPPFVEEECFEVRLSCAGPLHVGTRAEQGLHGHLATAPVVELIGEH